MVSIIDHEEPEEHEVIASKIFYFFKSFMIFSASQAFGLVLVVLVYFLDRIFVSPDVGRKLGS
jgi:hypothetical protein